MYILCSLPSLLAFLLFFLPPFLSFFFSFFLSLCLFPCISLYMCVCVYVCMYTHRYLYTNTHINTFMKCIYTHVHSVYIYSSRHFHLSFCDTICAMSSLLHSDLWSILFFRWNSIDLVDWAVQWKATLLGRRPSWSSAMRLWPGWELPGHSTLLQLWRWQGWMVMGMLISLHLWRKPAKRCIEYPIK